MDVEEGGADMSANNAITISRRTFKVHYYPCVDNEDEKLIGKGEDLEEAVDMAMRYIEEELGGMCEYGIRFYGGVR